MEKAKEKEGQHRSERLERLEGFTFTVLTSRSGVRRGEAAARRTQRAADWLAALLDFDVSFRLLVLSPEDWNEHTRLAVYGMPQTVGGDTIVIGVETPDFYDDLVRAFQPDVSSATRRRIAAVYGEPPRLGQFADLLVVHELGHLFHEQVPFDFPRFWLNELFANLALYGYVATHEPCRLPVLLTLADAAAEISPERMPVSTLAAMAQALEAGPTNYGWHQLRLALGAKAIWDSAGERCLRELHRAFRRPMSDAEVVEALRAVDIKAEQLAVEWPDVPTRAGRSQTASPTSDA